MALDNDLAYTSAAELARRVRDGEVSAAELVDATIERIEERNADLNAVVYKGYDDARRAASAADDAVRAGDPLGPLHGVPTLMKDLFDFKPGWKSTFGGIPALADQVIDAYCVFAERVEAAGAIIVGKTNSPVMGMRGTCDNPLFGPSRNPFDTTKNAGGSSGGSAAAVADGFVPFAEGTDAGGSIRIPAAWCGVYGFKPSWGRVPVVIRPNAFAGTDPFVAEGPITRTVEDAALGAVGTRRPRSARSLRVARHPRADGGAGRRPSRQAHRLQPRLRRVPRRSPRRGRGGVGRWRRSRRPGRRSNRSTSRCRTTSSSSPTCGAA